MPALGLRQQLDLDPDARPHGHDGLAYALVVDVAVVGAIHADLETVRIAGLDDQLFRRFGIVGKPLVHGRVVTLGLHSQKHARGPRTAEHDTALDGLDVDGLVEGPAHPNVAQGVLPLDVGLLQLLAGNVHGQQDDAHGRLLHDTQARRPVHPLDVLQGNRAHHVQLARQQRRHPGGIGRDRREDDFGQIMLGRVPPVGIVDENRLGVRLAGLEDERAGAVGVGAGVAVLPLARIDGGRGARFLGPLLVHDIPGYKVVEQGRVGRIEFDVDREVVDLDHVLHGVKVAPERRVFVGSPLVGENHVIGVEVVAVVELDALPEVKTPGRVIGDLPPGRQRRFEFQGFVVTDQAFVDAKKEALREALPQSIGIHRVDVSLVGPPESLGLGGL